MKETNNQDGIESKAANKKMIKAFLIAAIIVIVILLLIIIFKDKINDYIGSLFTETVTDQGGMIPNSHPSGP